MQRRPSPPSIALAIAATCAAAACPTPASAQGRAHGQGSTTSQFQRHNDLIEPPVEEATDGTAYLTKDFNYFYDQYIDEKKFLEKTYDIKYDIYTSYFLQSVTPHGGKPVNLLVVSPSFSWKPFTDTAFGSGQFTFAYSDHQFLAGTTRAQQARMGTITAPNDWLVDSHTWSQVSYTQTLPGSWKWLSGTVGQYSIGQFDGDKYAGNAQTAFMTYALAQNATQTYPDAGLGGYVIAAIPNTKLSISGGWQGATDVSGSTITASGYDDGKIASFGNLLWKPTIAGLGSGTYNILFYHQPSVPRQPTDSFGVSFAAAQDLGKRYGVFLRANHAGGDALTISTSLAGGGIVNDPFGRHPNDRLGIGLFVDWTNFDTVRNTVPDARRVEYGTEVYYNYTLMKGLQITPEFAAFIDPALVPDRSAVYLFSLRLTSFF